MFSDFSGSNFGVRYSRLRRLSTSTLRRPGGPAGGRAGRFLASGASDGGLAPGGGVLARFMASYFNFSASSRARWIDSSARTSICRRTVQWYRQIKFSL